jgi:16S rRNA (guanine527-N7)-methyltransferase
MNPALIAELLEPFLPAPNAIAERGRLDTGRSEFSARSHGEQSGAGVCALSSVQLQQISTYIDILLRWNARINLTAIRDPEEIVTRHFGESLFLASRLFPPPSSVSSVPSVINAFDSIGKVERKNEEPPVKNDSPIESAVPMRGITLADIGSGAGFPGLPIKLWAPQISLTLIESNHKKATFLREVSRVLTLTDIYIQNTRAEILTANNYDVVTLRAVERFESILPVAASLLRPASRLALLIGASQQDQATTSLPHLAWSKPVQIPNSRTRVMLIGQAIKTQH